MNTFYDKQKTFLLFDVRKFAFYINGIDLLQIYNFKRKTTCLTSSPFFRIPNDAKFAQSLYFYYNCSELLSHLS